MNSISDISAEPRLSVQKSYKTAKIFIIFTQVIGLCMVALLISWVCNYKGSIDWTPRQLLNLHNFFMILSIFFCGNAILIYRLFPRTKKLYVKIFHALNHLNVIAFGVIGLSCIFNPIRNKSTPDMRSLHSWMGSTIGILISAQFFTGFVSFLFPKLSEPVRRWHLPLHKFWGVVIFGMCCANTLIGLAVRGNTLASNPNPGSEAIVIGLTQISVVCYALLVAFIVTKSNFARPPDLD